MMCNTEHCSYFENTVMPLVQYYSKARNCTEHAVEALNYKSMSCSNTLDMHAINKFYNIIFVSKIPEI